MSNTTPKRSMKRGLSALMADAGVSAADASGSGQADSMMQIERISPNPDQPRRSFAEGDLSDLAASISQKGVIQPLIVRPDPTNRGHYQIVAGERRWRAAQRAGLHEVPVVIRTFDDTEVLEVAIIENIQRSDLNAVEEAQGFRQLMDRFGHTQEQLSVVLGKSRSHVANLMRLLKLPDEVQDMLRRGDLTAGHARALINAADPTELAKRVISSGLSVRETERLVQSIGEKDDGVTSNVGTQTITDDADTRSLESELSAGLGLKVKVNHAANGKSGTLTLRYKTLEELDRIREILLKPN